MSAARIALVLSLALLAFPAVAPQEAGNRSYRRGDYSRAVERYREAIARHGGSPRLQYNLGTALLRLGDPAAHERLLAALEAQSPELRARAFYNLGNALAHGAERPGDEELRAAIDAYRRALLLDPERDEARWNLELTMRRLEERQSQMQGPESRPQAPEEGEGPGAPDRPQAGGGEAQIPQPGATRPQGARADASNAPFSRELAEQILRAVEERERALQREKLRRQRQRPRGPDW
jgi:Ca-activated chloride channel family protein